MKTQKLLGHVLLISGLITTSAFAMQDKGTLLPEATSMEKKMMEDNMMATRTMMMEDKMMMQEKEAKMKMMMAITNKSPRSEVAKLQQHLIDEGFLKVRKGTKLGYYGPLTRAAYAKYMNKMKMPGETMMKDEKMMQDKMGTDTMMKK